MRNIAVICSIVVGALILSFPAVAQQKTVKACQEEWRANKAVNQAKGITEKAYVTQCRAGGSAAQPAPAPTPSTSSKKTTTPAPTAAPTAAPAPAASTSPKTKTTTAPAPAAAPAATAPTGANQYATEAQAKARCGSGTVVWANLNSKIFHFAGHKDYGNTKSGAYMCERDATGQGMRAAKNEKHP
jgi:cytoskeletal protein RodZ